MDEQTQTGLTEVEAYLDELRQRAPNVEDEMCRPLARWPAAKVALWYRKRLEERFGEKRPRAS